MPGVGVSALRDIQIGYSCIERRVDPAIIEVVFGGSDRRSAAFTLGSERVDGEHAVLRLAKLRMALLDHRLGLLVLRLGRLHLGFRENYLRALLAYGLFLRSDRSLCKVHLIYRDELLGQQRLDTVIIVGRVDPFGVGAVEGSLGVGNICLGFVHRSPSAVDIRSGAVSICPRGSHGAHLRSDRPALVDYLPLQRVQVGGGFLQRVLIWPGIDLKEQFTLFDEGVVLYGKSRNGTVDLGSNADIVGEYFGVVGATVSIGLRD
jgi:hypothetical protein